MSKSVCNNCSLPPREQIKCVFKCSKPEPGKGNWINGEDLDKMKFPCFCSFETDMKDYRRFGELDFVDVADYKLYRLRELKQVGTKMVYAHQYIRAYLKDIIETFDIHILKGKIILFKEE